MTEYEEKFSAEGLPDLSSEARRRSEAEFLKSGSNEKRKVLHLPLFAFKVPVISTVYVGPLPDGG